MAQTVTMPQLGESVTEGTIARWLKQPGEHVDRYESIAEVITDKVNAEIPSPSEGTMGAHLVEEGAVVPVGAPICSIEGADAAAAGAATPAAVAAPEATELGATAPPAAPAAVEAPSPVPAAAAQAPGPPAAAAPSGAAPAPATGGAVRAPSPPPTAPAPARPPGSASNGSGADAAAAGLHVTPAVRMLAREHGVDLAQVAGSGLGGRVTKKDVLAHVQRSHGAGAPVPGAAAPAPAAAPAAATQPTAAPPPAAAAPGATAAPPATQLEGDTVVPLTQARRAIAEHMVRSKATSPHAWTMVEVDMTGIVRTRSRQRPAFEQATGVHLTFLPFVARATITALRAHPTLNSSFTADGILLRRDIHLGIAVALEDSLIVPVIRNADRLSLAGLAQAAADLGARARAGKLRVDELTGGTFTLNNTGALGLTLTQPIINQPQAAILAMDAIVKRAVVVDEDAIAVRSIMNLCLSFDHRVIDGLQAARFLRDVRTQLESVDGEASIL